MPMDDISQIRVELERMKRELGTGGPERGADLRPQRRRRPLLDLGLFLLAYCFWLIVVVTAEIAAGLGIHAYTALFALPCAWLTVAWLRKAPLHALLVAAAGALVLAAAAYGVSLLYDTAWDSSSYHKIITGMLTNGWDPFRQSFTEFVNAHDILPYNEGWISYQMSGLPKAAYMIGAAVYALTGSIESGKLFNLISMIACILIIAPLLKDAFRLNRGAAFLAAALASVNLITLSQIALYYADGFSYQMLTVAAVSFACILFKPHGTQASAAKLAAFMAVCIAVNLAVSAALYAAILCAVFIAVRAVQIWRAEDGNGRLKPALKLLAYIAVMAVCAVAALGASTYGVNALQHGDPFYGMLGQNTVNGLPVSLPGEAILALPLIAQFFGSMFSPVSDALFTRIDWKIPFTFAREEWALTTMNPGTGGWGMLFGGIFLVSVLVLLVTAVRMVRRSPRTVWLLLFVLAAVIVPAAFIPKLYIARIYLQPFWVPMAAIVCLLAPSGRAEQDDAPKYPVLGKLKFVLAGALCVLLIVNAWPGANYLRAQHAQTASDREKIAGIKASIAQGDMEFDVTTIARGQFYGLFFNLRDEGVNYHFSQSLPVIQDELLYYMVYALRQRGAERDAEAEAFLNELYLDGYLVAVAASGGSQLTERMTALVQAAGLMTGGSADPAAGYLAVIDSEGGVRLEQSGYAVYQDIVDETELFMESAETGVSIVIGGTEYGDDQSGFHIVIYDTVHALPVYAVRIDPGADPVMTEYPVRIGSDAE